MADNSKIQWTEATWNPIVGCDKVSLGCKNCYAIRDAHRMAGNPNKKISSVYSGLTEIKNGAPIWTGVVKFIEGRLDQPLRWTRPRMIFVNSQSDLFHESVSFETIDKIFAVMALCPQHTFQVLTKRPERMLEYFNTEYRKDTVHGTAYSNMFVLPGLRWSRATNAALDFYSENRENFVWPLKNAWLGASCENQQTYDERKQFLRDTPAAVHWFSFEPLLGKIIADYLGDWVVVGGESGHGARPMHPYWPCSLRDQCVKAGVPYFFKQWGEWLPSHAGTRDPIEDGYRMFAFAPDRIKILHRFGDGWGARRAGKKAAGRLLDGREWNEYPVKIKGILWINQI